MRLPPLRWPACSRRNRSQAQDYPTRAVKIIVPFPAGGSADVIPRVVGDWLSRKWGQPVVIENRVGAAGNIGSEIAYKAEPDGYTLLSAPPPPLVINQNLYPKLNFDPSQFIPIVVMARIPNSLVVTPKFAPKTVAEVIAYAKANPGKINSAIQGNGTTSHLTSEMFQMMAGVKFQHVPYTGSAPALERSHRRQRRHHVRQSRRVARAGAGRTSSGCWRWRARSAWRRCRICRRLPRRCRASSWRRSSRSSRRRARRSDRQQDQRRHQRSLAAARAGAAHGEPLGGDGRRDAARRPRTISTPRSRPGTR